MANASDGRAGRRRRRRVRPPTSERLRDWVHDHDQVALRVVLAITLVGSMLAIGAVHAGSLLVLAPIALLCGMLAAAMVPGARIPPPALVFFGLGVFSLLQAIPLPAGFRPDRALRGRRLGALTSGLRRAGTWLGQSFIGSWRLQRGSSSSGAATERYFGGRRRSHGYAVRAGRFRWLSVPPCWRLW